MRMESVEGLNELNRQLNQPFNLFNFLSGRLFQDSIKTQCKPRQYNHGRHYDFCSAVNIGSARHEHKAQHHDGETNNEEFVITFIEYKLDWRVGNLF